MLLIGGRNYFREFSKYFPRISKISLDDLCKKNSNIPDDELVIFLASRSISLQYSGKYKFSINFYKNYLDKLRDRNIIFVSSASVYGLQEDKKPILRTNPLLGTSDYAQEKIFLENRLAELGNKTVIIRPSGFYGGILGYTPKSFINSLRYYIKSQEFKTFDIDNGGTQIRDFTFLSDFVKFIYVISSSMPNKKTIFNYASTEPVSLSEIIDFVKARYKNITFDIPMIAESKIHSSLDVSDLENSGFKIPHRNVLDYLD